MDVLTTSIHYCIPLFHLVLGIETFRDGLQGSRTLLIPVKSRVHLPLCQQPVVSILCAAFVGLSSHFLRWLVLSLFNDYGHLSFLGARVNRLVI